MKAAIIHETDAVVAFLDILPRAPGHTVMVPKAHVGSILELDDAAIQALFTAVRDVERKLVERLDVPSFTVGINQGSASGQIVEHLHVHIIPRFPGDGGGSIRSVINNPPHESLEDIYTKITS